jgi:hypothetical protein
MVISGSGSLLAAVVLDSVILDSVDSGNTKYGEAAEDVRF